MFMGFSPSTRAKTSPSLLTFAVTVEFLVGRKNHRPAVKGMGRNGRHDNSLDGRVEHGTAGRKRMGRRPKWGLRKINPSAA